MTTIKRYIATDSNGETYVYSDLPFRNTDGTWFPKSSDDYFENISLIDPALYGIDEYPKWEDEPIVITIKFKAK